MRLTLPEIKKKISKIIPDGIDHEVTLEAGSIAIITKQPKEFSGGGESLTVRIAKSVKRRVVIRPHPEILSDEQEVHDAVNRIIPADAMVRKTWLDPKWPRNSRCMLVWRFVFRGSARGFRCACAEEPAHLLITTVVRRPN